jgi:REP element-mobilizing transposase RayT
MQLTKKQLCESQYSRASRGYSPLFYELYSQEQGAVKESSTAGIIWSSLNIAITGYYPLLKTPSPWILSEGCDLERMAVPPKNSDGTTLKAFHIVWVTHNSRISERMVVYGVKLGEAVVLDESMEYEITGFIKNIITEDKLEVLAYAICQDHVHIVLVCSETARDTIVRKLKGKSAQLYKDKHKITDQYHLWSQKYHWEELTTDKQFQNVLNYVTHNRQKHELATSAELQDLIADMLTPVDEVYSRLGL